MCVRTGHEYTVVTVITEYKTKCGVGVACLHPTWLPTQSQSNYSSNCGLVLVADEQEVTQLTKHGAQQACCILCFYM